MIWYSVLTLYRKILLPLLSTVDAERSHEVTLWLLERVQRRALGRRLLRALAGDLPARPVEVLGLTFANPLGVAAGFDKDARVAAGLGALGFGHVEVGTLTPRPQEGNPRPRIFRLPEDRALINRMGFPNHGVEGAVPRLAALAERERGPVVGVSLGKQKETPLERAAEDYLAVLEATWRHAGYLVVNVSSPNTPGLRDLQGGRHLEHLLGALTARLRELAAGSGGRPRPLLVKIAPDLTFREIDEVLSAVEAAGVAGVVAVNTTVSREGLRSPRQVESGGLSGRPLAPRADEVIDYLSRATRGRLPIVGVGGVSTADDVRAKLDAGASLVQLYTGLVYEGPGVAGRLLRGLG